MKRKRYARVSVVPVDPAAPTVDGRLIADVATRPPAPAPAGPEPLTPYNSVTDIRCTRPGCRRVVRDVSVFEALTALPCPLCARCPDCRWLCVQGLVDHELDDTW